MAVGVDLRAVRRQQRGMRRRGWQGEGGIQRLAGRDGAAQVAVQRRGAGDFIRQEIALVGILLEQRGSFLALL